MNCLTTDMITSFDYSDKKVLVIGAGWMARQYLQACKRMGVSAVTVVSVRRESAEAITTEYGYLAMHGGFESVVPSLEKFDLVLICTPIEQLIPATLCAIKNGNQTILVEKPGTLYSGEFEPWIQSTESSDARIRVAYNRLAYPNLWKLLELIEQDGGALSCSYTFTEWTHKLTDATIDSPMYRRWGIANSLHVISLAHHIIGMPSQLSAVQSGTLAWHPSGSIFVGSGISNKNIPFSYHANWTSAGRWGIDVMTMQNAYRLMPIEELWQCPKGSVKWDRINCPQAYDDVKLGIAEEIAIMLRPELEKLVPLPTLREAANYTNLAETIFGYSSKPL